MSDLRPFLRRPGEPGAMWAADMPPADRQIPGPDVLGPIAERDGIEAVGPLSREAR